MSPTKNGKKCYFFKNFQIWKFAPPAPPPLGGAPRVKYFFKQHRDAPKMILLCSMANIRDLQ